MSIDLPSVSIVMPCYNGADHLVESTSSVRNQIWQDWELVIVDDGSSDSSWELLQVLAIADPRIRVFHQCNSGAASARNRGLREVRGKYIAFLDSDDTWHPAFLEEMVCSLSSNIEISIAYCGWQNLGLSGGRGDPYVPPEYEGTGKTETLLSNCPWPIHAVMVRSSAILEAGGFDETLSSCMDYDLWLRLGHVHKLMRVPKVLAYYHHHDGDQITKNRARIAFNHWRAQIKFLSENPQVIDFLGKKRISQLTDGELLLRGYASYWKRDFFASRLIFRKVMLRGYGQLSDWKYMLPSLLPLSWHLKLVQWFETKNQQQGNPPKDT